MEHAIEPLPNAEPAIVPTRRERRCLQCKERIPEDPERPDLEPTLCSDCSLATLPHTD